MRSSEDGHWKNSEITVSIHTQSRLVEVTTSTKKLGWSLPACPEQEVGDSGGFLMLT